MEKWPVGSDKKTASLWSVEYSLEGLIWSWSSSTLATWYKEPTYWKRPWCWERLKAGEGDHRGWDDWMASPTQWTWVLASSVCWWWTGNPGLLQSIGSQRVRHNQITELNVYIKTRLRNILLKIFYLEHCCGNDGVSAEGNEVFNFPIGKTVLWQGERKKLLFL